MSLMTLMDLMQTKNRRSDPTDELIGIPSQQENTFLDLGPACSAQGTSNQLHFCNNLLSLASNSVCLSISNHISQWYVTRPCKLQIAGNFFCSTTCASVFDFDSHQRKTMWKVRTVQNTRVRQASDALIQPICIVVLFRLNWV